MVDRAYCYKCCEIGKAKSEQFLNMNNSAYDAAMDFSFFVDKCFETCPYKEHHKKTANSNEI